MQLIPFNNPLRAHRFSDEFNKMLSHWSAFGDDETNIASSDWSPAVDVKEEDKCFLITADIPGVNPEDVDVTMHNGLLTIKGERSDEKKEEKVGYSRVERFSGSFYRRFMLPDTADSDNVKAKTKNGVLEIEIAKNKEVQTKKIKVES